MLFRTNFEDYRLLIDNNRRATKAMLLWAALWRSSAGSDGQFETQDFPSQCQSVLAATCSPVVHPTVPTECSRSRVNKANNSTDCILLGVPAPAPAPVGRCKNAEVHGMQSNHMWCRSAHTQMGPISQASRESRVKTSVRNH